MDIHGNVASQQSKRRNLYELLMSTPQVTPIGLMFAVLYSE